MDGGGYGQNIAAGINATNVGQVITGLFYNDEIPLFDGLFGAANPDMSLFEKWGHFSQIVWKNSTKVGCYTMDCSQQGLANVGPDTPPHFTVCNYDPPGKHMYRACLVVPSLTMHAGNYAGEYGAQVGSPLGMPTLQGYSA